jgi:ribonuclease HI
VLRFGGVKKEFFGFDPHTTNNRMELMAPIEGLLALRAPCEVEITTDSECVLHGSRSGSSSGAEAVVEKAWARAQRRSLDGAGQTGLS